MSDAASLDALFARKDRARKKKQTTTHQHVPAMTPANVLAAANSNLQFEEEQYETRNAPGDEWKDFEEKKIDFSGLKITPLGASTEAPVADAQKPGKADEGDESEPSSPVKAKPETTWALPTDAPKPQAEAPAPATGVYVPTQRRWGQTAPPVVNDISFPSLSDSHSKTFAKDMEGFQEVKSKGGRQDQVAPAAAAGSSGKYIPPAQRNKFGSLGNA